MVRHNHGSTTDAARYHVNSNAVTLHNKLANTVVRCAADFMIRRDNLHYKIASQHKLKSDDEYVPKSAQIKLELSVEKGKTEAKDFQALSKNHLQVLAEYQSKLKYLVIDAGDLDLVEKKKLAIISFMESVHNISERLLTYYYRKDINAHQCSIDIIELYSNHIAVHLNASKERLIEENQEKIQTRRYASCARQTPPGYSHFGCPSSCSTCPRRKLWRAGPAPFQR